MAVTGTVTDSAREWAGAGAGAGAATQGAAEETEATEAAGEVNQLALLPRRARAARKPRVVPEPEPEPVERRANPDWGHIRPDSSPGMADLWARAAALDAEQRPEGAAWHWVPWAAIEVRDDLMPRMRTDTATIERYAAIIDDLPPVLLESGTLRLIGGLHRMKAAITSARDHVRAATSFTGGDDDLLADLALIDNVRHGLPMTPTERAAGARGVFYRHHPITGGSTGEAWTVDHIAQVCGVSHRSVRGWLEEWEAKAAATGVDPRATATPTAVNTDGLAVANRMAIPRRGATATAPAPAWRGGWVAALADAMRSGAARVVEEAPEAELEHLYALATEAADWFAALRDEARERVLVLREPATTYIETEAEVWAD